MPDRIVVSGDTSYIVTGDEADRWDDSPTSLILDDDSLPLPHDPHDFRRLYLDQNGQRRTRVSPAVFAMGKLPYPQLRNLKHFENGKTVPSYNPKLPWMGYGKILRYFTPEALIQFGIINLSPSFRISSNFEVDPRAIKAIRSKERFAPDNSGIHPIFKNTPDHWDHTSDLMYEYLKPSLRIASKILDMEVVLDFLTAVGKPWVEEEPTLLHEAKSGQKQYSFYPKPLTSAERAVTAEALIHMQDFVDFDWDFSSPLSVAAYTITRKVWDKSHKRMVWDRGMCDYAGS